MSKFSIICVLVLCAAYSCNGLNPACPLSNQMTQCAPKCKDDTECFGQTCCPNICNTKSCTPANKGPDKYANSGNKASASGGSGSYCGSVKCNSFEKCQLDKSSNRQKCVRT